MSGFNLMHSGFEEMILIVEFFVPCTLILIQAWYNRIYLFDFAYPESLKQRQSNLPILLLRMVGRSLVHIYTYISIMKLMEIFMCLCDPWIH